MVSLHRTIDNWAIFYIIVLTLQEMILTVARIRIRRTVKEGWTMQTKSTVKPRRSVTSRDVAKLAGVSQSTVSRAYNPEYKLDPVLKEKVLDAARELGYSPNALARGLLSNRSGIIAIVTAYLDNPFYARVLQLFTSALQSLGFQSLLFVPEHNEDIDTVIDNVLSYRVDLVLLFGARVSTKAANTFNDNGIPTVLFNRNIPLSQSSAVCCNDYQCGYLVANVLFDSGCRKFAFISGHSDASTNIDRQRGYTDGLRFLGVDNCAIVQGGYRYEDGFAAAERLLSDSPDTDAIFCINDVSAVGVLDYIKSNTDKRIPEDISVVGFDDISIASHISNSLSTVRQPLTEMVDSTIKIITELLEEPNQRPVLKIINGEFVKRKTTR